MFYQFDIDGKCLSSASFEPAQEVGITTVYDRRIFTNLDKIRLIKGEIIELLEED